MVFMGDQKPIGHQLCRNRILKTVFHKKEWSTQIQIPCARKGQIFFCKKPLRFTKKISETDIINMLEFLIDNIFVFFGGRVFQQTVGIPMGTNCSPLLADLFLYSYEAEVILLKKNEKKLTRSFNFAIQTMSFHYIVLGLVISLIASIPLSLK